MWFLNPLCSEMEKWVSAQWLPSMSYHGTPLFFASNGCLDIMLLLCIDNWLGSWVLNWHLLVIVQPFC